MIPEWIQDIYYMYDVRADFKQYTILRSFESRKAILICTNRNPIELTTQECINKMAVGERIPTELEIETKKLMKDMGL